MLPAPFLPLEIVENIVHHVVASDPPATTTLLSCALVSTIWLKAARTYFFPSFCFYVRAEGLQRLETLQLLFRSPLCTMHLGKIEQLYMDPWDPALDPFLEWCAQAKQVFRRAKEIKMVNPYRVPGTLSISALSVLAKNLSNVSHISLCGVGLSTFKQFSDFLISFPQLQSLECAQIHAPRKDTKKLVVLHQLRKLRVERFTFFRMFYGSIAFSCLKDLDFYDNLPLLDPQNELRRIHEVGYMLSYAGHHLRRLRLALEVYPSESYIRNIRSRISKWLDLSIKAPLLQELELDVYNTMVLTALTFENPHPALQSIKIQSQTFDYSELDAILERSTPSLQHLEFPFYIVLDRERLEGWYGPYDRPKQAVKGDAAWEKQQQKLELVMPWCARKNCLAANYDVTCPPYFANVSIE